MDGYLHASSRNDFGMLDFSRVYTCLGSYARSNRESPHPGNDPPCRLNITLAEARVGSLYEDYVFFD